MKGLAYTFLLIILSIPCIQAQELDGVYHNFDSSLATDSTKSSVRKFGFYISTGIGFSGIRALPTNVAGLTIVGIIFSGSLAYKSHIASLTYTRGGSTFSGVGERDNYFSNSYCAFLLGESLRFKYSLISLNVGIANSELEYRNVIDRYHSDTYDRVGLSFPIELKLYFLAKHGIGFGVHLYRNLDKYYSTSFISASIVSGIWNK